MSATAVSRARTRAFARVLGPYLTIATGIIFVQAPDMTPALTRFFANPALVFITAALMLFAGVFVIANHQYCRAAPRSSFRYLAGSSCCGRWR